MKKQLLILNSDNEAEHFVANSDLTEYDLSGFKTVRFEFRPKTGRAEAHRQSAGVAASAGAAEDQAFIDSVSGSDDE